MSVTPPPTLDDAARLLAAADQLLDAAVGAARTLTEGGRRIDDHQVTTERVAYAATEARAARELPDIEFAIRPHPTMEHPAHEGEGALRRIEAYVRWLDLPNLMAAS